MVLLLALACGTATAQLTPEDIDALRQQGQAEGWTFTIGENPVTQRPIEELCGTRLPADWRERGRFVAPPEKFLAPPQFDWRDVNGCTPVKDQGGCGSCWAFATVGPLESGILIRDGVEVDLSEQWLINCNTDGYNCKDGGWFAHDYHMTKEDACGDVGAVLESACIYTGTEDACECPYPHVYTIDSWAFVGGEEDIPPVDAIKWAIMAYGPVSVCVFVDLEFGTYTGGVFNYHRSDEINHAVVLVGWDDTQGAEGVWILRNSWGPYWGEDGYMRIEYGCSSVGLGACFVEYTGGSSGTGPTITEQPVGARLPQGFMHVFSVGVTPAKGAARYQWRRDGEPVTPELPYAEYVVFSAQPEDQGTYTCVVKDPTGTVLSDEAYLQVVPGPLPAGGRMGLCLLGVFVVFYTGRTLRGAPLGLRGDGLWFRPRRYFGPQR